MLNVTADLAQRAGFQIVIEQQMRSGMVTQLPGVAGISYAQFSNSQLSNFNLD
ncbi:Uncharacterised protein [Raoultella planticola]|nr:Uncharacterised protein [Raoultella planticola]